MDAVLCVGMMTYFMDSFPPKEPNAHNWRRISSFYASVSN